MSLNTTPRTCVSGEVVTAAEMNTEVRDALTGIQASWSTFTPTWTAVTTNPTIGNGTMAGRSNRIGHSLDVLIQVVMGSTTTFGVGAYQLSSGFTANNTGIVADGGVRDVSASKTYPMAGELVPTVVSSYTLRLLNTTAGNEFIACTATAPMTFANGDYITLEFRHEI